MSLGETIHRLRTAKNMSQGDLADALEVSRQSISKWENDGSVPELDKLVKMGALFGVSLDELVLGEEPPKAPGEERPARETPRQQRQSGGTRRVVGVILLCFGALIWLLLTLMAGLGGLLGGLMFASPFLLCGVICLTCRKHVGLWCVWAVLFTVDVYIRFATGGITWRLALLTAHFEPSMNYLRLATAWAELVVLLVMAVVTVIRFGKTPLKGTRRVWLWFAAGWAVFALLHIPVPLEALPALAKLRHIFLDWCKGAVLIPLLAVSLRLLRGRKMH